MTSKTSGKSEKAQSSKTASQSQKSQSSKASGSSKSQSSKTSGKSSARAKSSSAKIAQEKVIEKQPLPSPLNEVDDGRTEKQDLPNRDALGEPTEQVGGDRKMDRGRLTVPPFPSQPEVVHNRTRRTDRDALTGHAVEITEGEHKGKHGIFEKVDEWEKDGFPKHVIVSLNRVTGYLLSLPYKHIRHLPEIQP